MKIIKIPRIRIKGIETLLSTIISVIHSFFLRCDIYMVFNAANSPALLFYKVLKKNYALNTDGLEWQRKKWGFFGRNYYKLSERLSVLLCSNLISDSQGIHDYYKKKYNTDSTIIAYGADILTHYPDDKVYPILNKFGIEKKKYLLQVTRFEPENHPLLTLRAFNLLHTDFKCVIIGGVNFHSAYSNKIQNEKQKNNNIILPGFIYNKEELEIIWQNAFCYIHGNSVGGTNPALLQAMASGRPVIALDCRFNRDTLGGKGYFFSNNVNSLCESIQNLINYPKEAELQAHAAVERIKSVYSWELITNQYEKYFFNISK